MKRTSSDELLESVSYPVVRLVFQNGTVRNVKQFHFYGWTDSIRKSGEGILDLIGQVQRAYEQQGEEGPITVHCR